MIEPCLSDAEEDLVDMIAEGSLAAMRINAERNNLDAFHMLTGTLRACAWFACGMGGPDAPDSYYAGVAGLFEEMLKMARVDAAQSDAEEATRQ